LNMLNYMANTDNKSKYNTTVWKYFLILKDLVNLHLIVIK
jgi:hypothetical protein